MHIHREKENERSLLEKPGMGYSSVEMNKGPNSRQLPPLQLETLPKIRGLQNCHLLFTFDKEYTYKISHLSLFLAASLPFLMYFKKKKEWQIRLTMYKELFYEFSKV